ncbi:MAG: hypothetical protein P8Y94_13075, partial [Acidobacteriota bacterium]
MRRQRIPLVLLLIAACLYWNVAAEDDPYDHETWKNGYFNTSTYGGFLSGGGMYSLDVNKYSGGVNLHIPILSLPGRAGHDLSLYATYNSKQFWLENGQTWDAYHAEYVYTFHSHSYLPGPNQGRWILNIWPSLVEESPNGFLFTTPDGAVHRLDDYSGYGWYVATDGSYLAYNYNTKRVAYPS